VLNTSSVLCES